MINKFYCPTCEKVVKDTTKDVFQVITKHNCFKIVNYIHQECSTKLIPLVSEDLPLGYNPYQE